MGFLEQSPFATSDIIGHITMSFVIYAVLRYGHSRFSKMAGGRILHLVQPEVGRSIQSAVPENPTIGSNTKSIGRSVSETWPFETLTLMTSLMTSQGPDQKSVKKNYFPQVGNHRVKKSAQSDKKCRRRSIWKTMDTHTQPATKPQNSTLSDFKGCLKL